MALILNKKLKEKFKDFEWQTTKKVKRWLLFIYNL